MAQSKHTQSKQVDFYILIRIQMEHITSFDCDCSISSGHLVNIMQKYFEKPMMKKKEKQ